MSQKGLNNKGLCFLKRIYYKCNKFWNEKNNTVNNKKNKLKSRFATDCYICSKIFIKTFARDRNHRKVKGYCSNSVKYREARDNIFQLKIYSAQWNCCSFSQIMITFYY